VCLPVLTFPCTIKSRSSLLAPAHPGGPGKMVVGWCGGFQLLHCVSKNVPPLTCYNLYIHGSIATFFGTNVAKKVGNQNVLYFPTSPI